MSIFRLRAGRLAAAGAGGLALVLLAATAALADTSASTASALQISQVGGGGSGSGSTTASNDGSTQTQTGTQFPTLAVLGTQSVISSGVLAQVARAFNDGTSAACAGVVGTGGTITVGDNGVCTANSGAEVTLTLGVNLVATISLVADAIYANCDASSASTATGAASLVNARITSTVLGVETTLLNLPANPAPNTALNIAGILNLNLNGQSSSGPGHLDVTALNLSVLSGTLASVVIGNVTCGPNAIAAPVPAIPMAGAPIALGVLALLVTGGFFWRRRVNLAKN